MKPYLRRKLARGVSMLFQDVSEDDIKLAFIKKKKNITLSILIATDKGDVNYRDFVGTSYAALQKEAFDWLRVSLYDTYRAKKVEFDNSIRKIVNIEKYVFETFDVSLNPRR